MAILAATPCAAAPTPTAVAAGPAADATALEDSPEADIVTVALRAELPTADATNVIMRVEKDRGATLDIPVFRRRCISVTLS